MKEIDIAKVRTAILTLQNMSAKESAQAVWDLLDQYVAQKPKAPAMRGALDGCKVHRFNTTGERCAQRATGHLVMMEGETSYPLCAKHGEAFELQGHADWVQADFGDEDSAEATR